MKKILSFCVLSFFLVGCQLETSYSGEGQLIFADGAPPSCAGAASGCYDVPYNQIVRISALPKAGYLFKGWQGDCQGLGVCEVKMSQTKKVHAYFEDMTLVDGVFFHMRPGSGSFFDFPWPSDMRMKANGSIDVAGFPFAKEGEWSKQVTTLAKDVGGYSNHGGIFFRLDVDTEIFDTLTDSGLMDIDGAMAELVAVGSEIETITESTVSKTSIPLEVQTHNSEINARDNLVMFVPKAGHSLKPSNQYALIVYKDFAGLLGNIDLKQDQLMLALSKEWSIDSGVGEEHFLQLQEQYNQVKKHVSSLGKDIRDVVAFTVFTTQQPFALGESIKSTLDTYGDDKVLSSITEIETLRECPSNGRGVEAFAIDVQVPNFLTGKSPFLFSGGDIKFVDNAAQVQSTTPLTYLLKIPCDEIPDQGFPLVIRGESTFDHWQENDYQDARGDDSENRGVIEIFVDAPFSEARRYPKWIGGIKNLLGLSSEKIRPVLEFISHFNPFNLHANVGLHYQYGVELAYARRVSLVVGELLPSSSEGASEGQNNRYQVNFDQLGIAGDSFGGIAAIHAMQYDDSFKALELTRTPRPSYLFLHHISSLAGEQDYIPPQLFDAVASYAGVTFPMKDSDPVAHILQTVLEPMDVNNMLNAMEGRHFYMGLDYWDDAFHGGNSAYSLLGVLSNKTAARSFFGEFTTEEDIEAFKRYSTLDVNYDDIEINPSEELVQIMTIGHQPQQACFMFDLFVPDSYSTKRNDEYRWFDQKRCQH